MMQAFWVLICAIMILIFVIGIVGEVISLFFAPREKGVKILSFTVAGILTLICCLIVLLLGYIGISEL